MNNKTILLIAVIFLINLKFSIEHTDLDLAFIIDNTASMGREINDIKLNIVDLIQKIKNNNELTGDTNLALITYRDYTDNYKDNDEIIGVKLDFSNDPANFINTIKELKARGGGDFPEAAEEAFFQAKSLNWKKDSLKVIIWITDSPPRLKRGYKNYYFNEEENLSYKNRILRFFGFSYSLTRTKKYYNSYNSRPFDPIINDLAETNIIVSSILIRNDPDTKAIMDKVARKTKGIVTTLNRSDLIPSSIYNIVSENLDRVRINRIIDNEIKLNLDELKKMNNGFLQQKYLVSSLASKDVYFKRMIFKTQNEILEAKENDQFQLKNEKLTLQELNNIIIKINPCNKYGIFCDIDYQIYDSLGLIDSVTKIKIPLLNASINVNIIEDNSNTVLIQSFVNGEEKCNTQFLIPLPFNAAVYYFSYTINGNKIEGKCIDKKIADRLFTYALSTGEKASLMTQENDNLFKIDIGNIEPKSNIEIEIRYQSKVEVDRYNRNLTSGNYVIPFTLFDEDFSKTLKIKFEASTSTVIKDLKIYNQNQLNELIVYDYRNNKVEMNGQIDLSQFKSDIKFSLNSDIFSTRFDTNKAIITSDYKSDKLYHAIDFSLFPLIPQNKNMVNSAFSFDNDDMKIDHITIFVDMSKSLENMKEEIKILTKKLIIELHKFTKNSKLFPRIDLIGFNQANKKLSKILNSADPFNLESFFNEEFLPESNFSDVFDSYQIGYNEYGRVFLISDFHINYDYDIIYRIYSINQQVQNFKLGAIGIGNNINKNFLEKIKYATKNSYLTIKKEEINSYDLNFFLFKTLSDKVSYEIKIYNAKKEQIYSSLRFNNYYSIICDDNFDYNLIGDLANFTCLFDKKMHNLIQIKSYTLELKQVVNERYQNLDYYTSFSNNESIQTFSIRNLILEGIKFDYPINMDITSVDKVLKMYQNIYYDIELYNESFNNFSLNISKSDYERAIVNIAENYSLSTRFTSFISLEPNVFENLLKNLEIEDRKEYSSYYSKKIDNNMEIEMPKISNIAKEKLIPNADSISKKGKSIQNESVIKENKYSNNEKAEESIPGGSQNSNFQTHDNFKQPVESEYIVKKNTERPPQEVRQEFTENRTSSILGLSLNKILLLAILLFLFM